MSTIVYFSYGSNMSFRRLHRRVSKARMIDVGRLEEHKLKFHKRSKDGSAKCDAVYIENSKDFVYGVAFEISISQLQTLNKFEGLGKGYEQKYVDIITRNRGKISALTYYATDIDASLKPYCWYKEHVLYGAREYELPKEYIAKIKKVDAIPDLNIKRHEEELIIYE